MKKNHGLSPQVAPRRVITLLVLVLATVMLAACGSYTFNGTAYAPVKVAPEIEGTQGNGQPFKLSDLKDKVVLLFFGYTSCPDICPMWLGDMRQVEKELGEQGEDLAVVLVSVDPERDTPEKLAAYTAAFSPSFYGVQVPADQLEAVKTDFGVFAQKRAIEGSSNPQDYGVDHTGWTYVIDTEGNLREIFATDMDIAGVVKDVQYLLR